MSKRGMENDIKMAYIFCITIVLMQLKFFLVVGMLEHPPSMIFLAQGGIDLICSVAPS